MCIAAWIWQAHPVYPLLLVLNRDEFHGRPTKAVEWWGEGCEKILGGRDILGGGTWMGCTKSGRLSFLTNVLEPDSIPSAKTRGDLPLRFLQGRMSPLEYAEEISKEADDYNGFNLVMADLCTRSMFCVSNRPKGKPVTIQAVSPGLHVLTNANLDAPWHKAERLGKSFKKLLHKHGEEEISARDMAEKLMTDTMEADLDRLPNTGCDSEWERQLSSIFVEVDTKLGKYGTRSTAVLSVKENCDASLYERYLEGGVWKEHTINYHIENLE
ncbi:uncharacterized protein A4U43_C04F21030 [Asparagus officinalis]|uniref:Uncharacterized protein n=1 Tax=Asparagus officinalis TaxID=4686 RepID=A0A5P1F367_ASPOF|nr:transport and Golgi organization 2 homolog [Asparagus officinalis]ONK72594.1 uncharacterized protein A4U43_C04F21030 [Asparagus officinalis]